MSQSDCYYCSQVIDAYRVSGIQPYSCTIAHGSSVQLYMMSVDLDLTGCLEESIVVCRVCMLYDPRSYGMSLTKVNSHLSITKKSSYHNNGRRENMLKCIERECNLARPKVDWRMHRYYVELKKGIREELYP